MPFPTVTVDGGQIFDPEGYARKAWANYHFPKAEVGRPEELPVLSILARRYTQPGTVPDVPGPWIFLLESSVF